MRWCRSAQSGESTTEVGEVSGEELRYSDYGSGHEPARDG
jgi:hypothetical protein